MEFIISSFFIISMLLYASFSDFKKMEVPDYVHFIIALGIIPMIFFTTSYTFLESFYGFLLGGGLMYLIAILGSIGREEGAMGGADIKIMAALGLWFGVKGIISVILLSFIVGLFFAIFYIIKYKSKDIPMPFIPSICVASIIVWFNPSFIF